MALEDDVGFNAPVIGDSPSAPGVEEVASLWRRVAIRAATRVETPVVVGAAKEAEDDDRPSSVNGPPGLATVAPKRDSKVGWAAGDMRC